MNRQSRVWRLLKKSLAEKAAPAAGAPGAPKPPVKKKEEGPKPTDASNHQLVQKLKSHFNGAIREATEFLGQLSVRVDPDTDCRRLWLSKTRTGDEF